MEYLQYSLEEVLKEKGLDPEVLNLVISGIPSILMYYDGWYKTLRSFKPCYKWNTFNTDKVLSCRVNGNLCFKPCYKWNTFNTQKIVPRKIGLRQVLNLVISGIPSILKLWIKDCCRTVSFKPCYKWNTFNTPSILCQVFINSSFKPCYKWNTFNTN